MDPGSKAPESNTYTWAFESKDLDMGSVPVGPKIFPVSKAYMTLVLMHWT